MTKIGLDAIKERIHSTLIFTPDLNAEQLRDWLNGYIACLNIVDDVLKEFADDLEEDK